MSKKSIVLAAASIMTAATVAIGGTLAYFNANAEVKNTFSMGGSSGGDTSFSILLDESDVTLGKDANGTATWTVKSERISSGVDYGTNVYPGAKLPKDPMVTNTGEFPLYARMIVTLPNADVWAGALGTTTAAALADEVFTETPEGFSTAAEITDNKLVVTYTWESVVAPNGTTGKPFTTVNIPANFTGSEEVLKSTTEITVRAEAIQSAIDGVDTAAEAFAKYPTTGA